ncbi:MAG: hypothetical protein MRK01_12035 [Candidatus Scalindua sp.]|nr:hypothetical protein [Candidatus Scalindua sp.]
MLKFIPERLRRIPGKCKSVPGRLDSFIQGTGGYKVFVYINLAILSLIVVLILLQQSWINKEKKAITDIVNVHNIDNVQKKDEAAEMSSGSHSGIAQEELHSIDELQLTIKKKIKEADLYFVYEQYDKAAPIYEELSAAKNFFDEKDKVLNNLAESYFCLGNFELAMETYRKLLNDYFNTPYRLNAQLGEGKCLIHLSKFGEARRVLYLLVAKEADYDGEDDKAKIIEAYYNIAESYIAQAMEHKDKGRVISNHENL